MHVELPSLMVLQLCSLLSRTMNIVESRRCISGPLLASWREEINIRKAQQTLAQGSYSDHETNL